MQEEAFVPANTEPPSDQSLILYTTFTSNEKRALTLLLGLATITSPLTATIYFPLLPLLRSHFHTSAQAINLTLTVYVIFQALSPAIFGPLSDSVGRRPVYILTLSVYIVGNLGLAINKQSYSVLIALRAVQSLGASAAFAVSYGVVADTCVPSERGSMLGPVSMALNLGACIGPVVGGAVAYTSGSYEWIFWALVFVGAILLLGVGALLPETARSVVGNGEGRKELKRWEQSWYQICKDWFQRSKPDAGAGDKKRNGSDREISKKRFFQRFRIQNPLSCLRMIFHLDTFLVLWMHGSFYTVDYSLVAAVPDIFKTIYHFNELQIGLAYLPRGIGIISGGYCVGKFLDHNYKMTAKKIGWAINSVSGDDIAKFPIEQARSRGSLSLLLISTATLLGYGWAVSKHAHVSVPLLLQFIQGFWGTCFYTTYNTLLVDVFPESPSTAAAAASITRCAMAAAGIAVLQPLLDAAGRGWYFTLLGLWSGGFGAVAVCLLRRYGMQWRTRRMARVE
ncbi:itaconate transport protein [Physcia stellaris]|nr:itaconate transport protein [Physcia stellaris]